MTSLSAAASSSSSLLSLPLLSLLGYWVTFTDGIWPDDDDDDDDDDDNNGGDDNDDDIILEHSYDSEFLITKFCLTVIFFLLYVYGNTQITLRHVFLNV